MKAIFLFLVLTTILEVKSQTQADTISLTTSFKGYSFIHQGRQISADSVMVLMQNN